MFYFNMKRRLAILWLVAVEGSKMANYLRIDSPTQGAIVASVEEVASEWENCSRTWKDTDWYEVC